MFLHDFDPTPPGVGCATRVLATAAKKETEAPAGTAGASALRRTALGEGERTCADPRGTQRFMYLPEESGLVPVGTSPGHASSSIPACCSGSTWCHSRSQSTRALHRSLSMGGLRPLSQCLSSYLSSGPPLAGAVHPINAWRCGFLPGSPVITYQSRIRIPTLSIIDRRF